MPDENVLSSYLVKLGASLDLPSISKFNSVLKEMASLTTTSYTGMAVKAAELQVATTTAFAGIAAAAIKMASSVSQTDLNYQLFALHMYMGTNAARGMKIAMDALGQPLENIAWNRELLERYERLIEDQRHLTTGLGPDFERNMRSLRDIRFEFTRLGVETKYLSMGLVSSIFDKLGLGSGVLLHRLEELNNWIITSAPKIIEFFSSRMAPVLLDIKDIFKDLWGGLEEVGTLFTNLVSLLSGDKSLEGTTFSFNKFATAVGDVTHALSIMIESMVLAEKVLVHLVDAAVLAAGGHFADASKELRESFADITSESMSVLAGAGGTLFGGILGGPLGALAGGTAGTLFGGPIGSGLGYFGAGGGKDTQGIIDSQTRFKVNDAIAKAAARYAQYGVSESLLRAIVRQESGGNPHPADAWGAGVPHQGLGQLSPQVQQKYGVRDPYDPYQNAMGIAGYLADLLKANQGNIWKAVAAYNGRGPDAQRYASQVLGYGYMPAPSQSSSSSVSMGDVHVHVQGTNADPNEIGRQVVEHIRRLSDMQNQRNSAQFSSPYAYANQ